MAAARLGLAWLCLAVSACAFMPGDMTRHDPRAISDAYLIAHGMAISYDERQDADPDVTVELGKLDMRARRALVAMVQMPDHDPDETARAVAALSNYAALQTNPPR
jgi:hypothetical protein